jgi:hypothetical protein
LNTRRHHGFIRRRANARLDSPCTDTRKKSSLYRTEVLTTWTDIHIGALCVALILLIGCSAFFSSSETGLMTLNRYRLRHRAKSGDKAAQRASKLLERPDRLIGIILLGNNFVNILASSLATVVAIHLMGETGIVVSTVAMTIIVLVFGEVAPKTLAALHPERVAFPASAVLGPLLKMFYPLVWLTNMLANSLLRLFRVSIQTPSQHSLSAQELRTVVLEAGVMIPKRHQAMLLSILELEEITVNDIMVPRNEMEGIDLEGDWDGDRDPTDPQPIHAPGGLPRHHRSGGGLPAPAQGAELDDCRSRTSIAPIWKALDPGAVFHPRRYLADPATGELPAVAPARRAGGGRVRRRAGAGDSGGHSGRNRGRIHHRSRLHRQAQLGPARRRWLCGGRSHFDSQSEPGAGLEAAHRPARAPSMA